MVTKENIVCFLKQLRDDIRDRFQELESKHQFEKSHWKYPSEGGGEISILRGDIFEKAAVNWSGIAGEKFPMDDASGPFFATGISLITHMANPHAPTVHMNLRYLETAEKRWFGGGYDLTPMGFPYDEDTRHFHQSAKKALDPFGEDLYPIFSQNAKEYFYIPHRKKERGVGGIFFDHLFSDNFENDYRMWQSVGKTFLDAIIPIYQKRIMQPYSPADRQRQLAMRAHYAEFNLVYDRGTQFGFKSGGNPEAILCSMPPLAKW